MRGRGYLPRLNTSRVLRIPTRMKTSRSTCSLLASSSNRRQAGGTNGAEGRATDEVVRLGRGRNPLERETWTWQRDETSPQGTARSKPSRACETLRTERRQLGMLLEVDSRGWCREEVWNPKEGAGGLGSCESTAWSLRPT